RVGGVMSRKRKVQEHDERDPAVVAAQAAMSSGNGTNGHQPGEFRMIEISHLVESPLNPRRNFDAAKLKELAESIGKAGIITPLLVRPTTHPGKHFAYE